MFSKAMYAIGIVTSALAGLVAFLAGIAAILSFVLDHPDWWRKNIENLAAHIAPAPAPPSAGTPKCAVYEKRVENPHCDQKSNPMERLLCRVTVPPVTLVCAGGADTPPQQHSHRE